MDPPQGINFKELDLQFEEEELFQSKHPFLFNSWSKIESVLLGCDKLSKCSRIDMTIHPSKLRVLQLLFNTIHFLQCVSSVFNLIDVFAAMAKQVASTALANAYGTSLLFDGSQ